VFSRGIRDLQRCDEMAIHLRICFSSQPVLSRRRAVRRGANAGPVCGWCHTCAADGLSVAHADESQSNEPVAAQGYVGWLMEDQFGEREPSPFAAWASPKAVGDPGTLMSQWETPARLSANSLVPYVSQGTQR